MIESTNEAGAAALSTEELIARVVGLSQGMREHVVDAVDRMSDINRGIHLLSMNARVEAARAGVSGAGFAVVAQELTRLSANMKEAATDVVRKSQTMGSDLDVVVRLLNEDVVAKRLCDLAYNAIDVIDRNLYERSCDVRWWATEPAVADCLREPSAERRRYASQRLGQILDSYTVYTDLVITDAKGEIVANGRTGTSAALAPMWHRPSGSAPPWPRRMAPSSVSSRCMNRPLSNGRACSLIPAQCAPRVLQDFGRWASWGSCSTGRR